jgi:hypothetical protein
MMAMNVVAKQRENKRVPNALFVLSLAPSDTDVGKGLAMDEAVRTVGASVFGGGVDVGHGQSTVRLTQVQNAE